LIEHKIIFIKVHTDFDERATNKNLKSPPSLII